MFIANVGLAQDEAATSGIYLTKEQFLSDDVHHLARNDKQNSIKIGSNQAIVIKHGDERTKFRFNDVYGYKSSGERYRKFGAIKLFQKYGYAKLIDDRSLYSANYATYKVGRVHYFYSLSTESQLRYLSKKNLRKDFSEKQIVLQSIEGLTFKELISHTDGKYLISDPYEKSLK